MARYVSETSIQHGETGTAIPQESMDYLSRTAGSVTVYELANDTVYANTNGTGDRTTSYVYTFYSSSTQIESVEVTLPTIGTGQNGPNVADTQSLFYDANGRPIWSKDGNGAVSYTAYDDATGAVVKRIVDVDVSALTTDEGTSFTATGWSRSGKGDIPN